MKRQIGKLSTFIELYTAAKCKGTYLQPAFLKSESLYRLAFWRRDQPYTHAIAITGGRLVEDELGIPEGQAVFPAVGVSNQDFTGGSGAVEHNKVSVRGEMPRTH